MSVHAAVRLSKSPIGPENRARQKEQACDEAEDDIVQPQALGTWMKSFENLIKTHLGNNAFFSGAC